MTGCDGRVALVTGGRPRHRRGHRAAAGRRGRRRRAARPGRGRRRADREGDRRADRAPDPRRWPRTWPTPGRSPRPSTGSPRSSGSLGVLVNNAGVTRDNLLFKMSEDDWDTVMAVHLRGFFLASRAAQRHMVAARWGRIISLSSVSALGTRGQVNYSAAKAGLQGATRTLAIELGPFGITANAVAPGLRGHRDDRPARRAPGQHAGGLHRGAGRRSPRSAGPAPRPTSPPSSRSWPATTPRSSPARRSTWTEDDGCDDDAHHPPARGRPAGGPARPRGADVGRRAARAAARASAVDAAARLRERAVLPAELRRARRAPRRLPRASPTWPSSPPRPRPTCGTTTRSACSPSRRTRSGASTPRPAPPAGPPSSATPRATSTPGRR